MRKVLEHSITPAGTRCKQEHANVISTAACYLAGVEREAGKQEAAIASVRQAEEAGKQSYIWKWFPSIVTWEG